MIKNKKVGSHYVDYLLTCGCIQNEPIEAAIFIPKVGDARTCNKHKTPQHIQRVGGVVWVDANEE